jgi:hypothetical protein
MESQIQQWWEEQNEQLITCPHQPGNLRISGASCAKRYAMAQRKQRMTRNQDAEFALNSTLERCRHCKIGKQQFRRGRSTRTRIARSDPLIHAVSAQGVETGG